MSNIERKLSNMLFTRYSDGKTYISTWKANQIFTDLGFGDGYFNNVARMADTNHDGYISMYEFYTFIKKYEPQFATVDNLSLYISALNLFRLYDVNNDGVISVDEYHELCHKIGCKSSTEEFRSIDTSNDNVIHLFEFVKWLKK